VLWTTVVPYTDPNKEIVTLVMLSSRCVYLVSDSALLTDSSPTSRPSWMTHNRHKSDSAVGWQTKGEGGEGGVGRGLERVNSSHRLRGHQWGSQVSHFFIGSSFLLFSFCVCV
jgi:hypothetical protein